MIVNDSRIAHQKIDDEVVVINLENGSYYSLRGAAAAIWPIGRVERSSSFSAARRSRRGTGVMRGHRGTCGRSISSCWRCHDEIEEKCMSWLKRRLPTRRWKRVCLYIASVLLILLAVFFVTTFARNSESVPTVDIGEVAAQARAGNVRLITVNGQDVTVELNDGKKMRARKEDTGSVIETTCIRDRRGNSRRAGRVDLSRDGQGFSQFGSP